MVTVFSKLNYYYEGGRTLFRTPEWCFFKLENSGLTISGFGIEILLYSGLLDFKFFLVRDQEDFKIFSSGLRGFQVF
jgi:hypothetical protein